MVLKEFASVLGLTAMSNNWFAKFRVRNSVKIFKF